MGCQTCGSDAECVSSKSSTVDVVIVGAGVCGNAIARELSKYASLKVAVVEKHDDICQGASKANSGICHGGYDATHGTLKSKLSRKGNRLFAKLNQELNFGYKEIGSLVLAFQESEVEKLEELMKNGKLNGVNDLELLSGEKIREMEPHVSIGVRAGLYCPTAGIVSPYEYGFALAENAMMNGVSYIVGDGVVEIEQVKQLSTKEVLFRVETESKRVLYSRIVINCAGLYADAISKKAGAARDFSIVPRKGQYVLLEKSQGIMSSRVIFQTPTERWGKGILVSPTIHGNLLIGPSAKEQGDKEERSTDQEELAYVAWAARRSVPHLDTRMSITSFSGLRARGSLKDFIIEEDEKVKGFVNVACIESPGLTSSPAIAEMVVGIVGRTLDLKPKTDFKPNRRHPVNFSTEPKTDSPVVCLCENITEAEIQAAIDQAGFPLKSTDSIKWRTRAGMGPCQGIRCRPKVANMLKVSARLTDKNRLERRLLCKL